ncbi:alpha/beta fold hydrolase [Novosphingobium sp.]|uniref:alpha/beta fold hydrolase n=1 Tax=Novosphingobium sp. TaxID=1874826 RepID=UPI0035AEEB0C
MFKPALQNLLDDPEQYLEEIRADPHAFAKAVLQQEGTGAGSASAIPSIASFAVFVFRPDGTLVSEVCPDDWPDGLPFGQLLEQLPGAVDTSRILFLRWGGRVGLRAVCLGNQAAIELNLPIAVREALLNNPDSRLLICANATVGSRALEASADSFGLSSLQQRVVIAIARGENGRTAAADLGLSYATVREALADAARRVGVPNLPGLVRRIVECSFGMLPAHFGNAAELADWLPLTTRQCQICELITEGINREATARAMRISPAVVKKELEQIFLALEVNSAAGLSRIWVEAQVLRFLARPTEGPLGFFDPLIEPTRFLPRADDHQIIAWSDYGPVSGKPVLIVHSNWTCRSIPRAMVMRLQAAGWRPIAIDRPGFGQTHPGNISLANPFEQAVIDTANVLNRLKIRKAAVIARRAGQFVTVLKQSLGDRIGPVLLTSPSAPTNDSGRRVGIVGVIKEAFYRSPQLVEFYFRVVTPQFSLDRMERLTRNICKGSPPDEKLCEDPQFIRDRFRAIRPFATGNLEGAIIEEMQVSRNLFALAPLVSEDVMIVQGEHDNHYAFEEVFNYWSQKWPRAEIRCVPDGGQFLTSSHPELLVDLLEELSAKPDA